MIGQKFGAWTVLSKHRGTGRHYYVIGICDCGTVREMRADTMKSGRSRSCGCEKSQNMSVSLSIHGGARQNPREYASWISMRSRCMSQRDKKFPDYGGRGITVCDRWNDFAVFLADVGPRPAGMTLGRIDNNKGYDPGNCRWETPKQQANNTRRNIKIQHQGRTMTAAAWSDLTGIKRCTIQARFHSGKSSNDILTKEGLRT